MAVLGSPQAAVRAYDPLNTKCQAREPESGFRGPQAASERWGAGKSQGRKAG